MQAEQEGACGSSDHQGSAHSSSGSTLRLVILSISVHRWEEKEGGGASVSEPKLQDGGRACLPADTPPQHPRRAQVSSFTFQHGCPCISMELFSCFYHFVYLKYLLVTVIRVKDVLHIYLYFFVRVQNSPDGYVPSSSPESEVEAEVSRYPDLSRVKLEPPSPCPSPPFPITPSACGKGG